MMSIEMLLVLTGIAAGIVIGMLMTGFSWLTPGKYFLFSLTAIVFGVLGGRAAYYLLKGESFADFLSLNVQGVYIYGIIAGIFVAALLCSALGRYNLGWVLDCAALSGAFTAGVAELVKIKSFSNYKDVITDKNLQQIPLYSTLVNNDGQYYETPFLVEGSAIILIFVILLFHFKRNARSRRGGVSALLFLLLYSIQKVLVERFIISDGYLYNEFRVTLILSIAAAVISVILLTSRAVGKNGFLMRYGAVWAVLAVSMAGVYWFNVIAKPQLEAISIGVFTLGALYFYAASRPRRHEAGLIK